MKKSTHSPVDSPERQHYKKKYIQRILSDKEADNEIKQFKATDQQSEVPYPQGMDEKRPM